MRERRGFWLVDVGSDAIDCTTLKEARKAAAALLRDGWPAVTYRYVRYEEAGR